MYAGEAGTDGEIHVAEKRMLCCVKADRNRPRVSGANLEINIAHGGIKGAGVGVRHALRRAGYHAARCRRKVVACTRGAATLRAGTRTSKEKHVGDAVVITGGMLPEHKHGARGSVANHPDSGPQKDRATDAITSLGNEDYPFPFAALHFVNRCLNGCGVICLSVRMSVEFGAVEVHSRRIIKPGRIGRCAQASRGTKQRCTQKRDDSHEISLG